MKSAVTELYEALLQRETGALRASIDTILESGTADRLWLELTRFSLLALAPTEQSQHALLAAIGAKSYLSNPRHAAAALTSVATYISQARLPWSEAPILEPLTAGGAVSIDSLVLAATEKRREIVESAIEALMGDRGLLLTAASRFDDELRHASIITGSIQRLVGIHPELRREGVRAIANTWITAARSMPSKSSRVSELRDDAIRYVEGGGDVTMFHALLFADVSLAEIDADAGIPSFEADEEFLSYNLARDYASAFLIGPLASRLSPGVDDELRLQVIDASRKNLASGPGFEDWLHV